MKFQKSDPPKRTVLVFPMVQRIVLIEQLIAVCTNHLVIAYNL